MSPPTPRDPVPDRSFVGRHGELAALRLHLDRARRGAPQVVLVEAPGGHGKTTLIGQLLRHQQDLRVVRATGDALEQDIAYGVLDQILRTAGAPPVAPGTEPLSAGAALLELHESDVRESTTVLVVDDAGWADLPSLQALTFALRRLQAEAVLTIVAIRPEALHRLPSGLLKAATEGNGTTLRLGGLDASAVQELAAAIDVELPRRAAQRVVDLTGGSPLHARALLEDVPAALLVTPVDGPLPAPRSFHALVAARMVGLPEPARRLAAAIAVLGGREPLPTAAALAEVPVPLEAVDHLVEADLVEEHASPGGPRIRFAHPLIESAVYHDIPPGRRARLHQHAAALVGEERSRLHHRVAGAEAPDDALVADLRRFAHAQLDEGTSGAAGAALAFEAASRVAPTPAARDDLRLDALECHLLAGDTAAIAGALAGVPDSGRKRYLVGAIALASGMTERAEQALRSALDAEAREPDLALHAAVAGQLAMLCMNAARLPEAVGWARRALGEEGSQPVVGSNPRVMLALALALIGDHEGASEVVELRPVEREALDRETLERLAGRGVVRLWRGDFEGASGDLGVAAREWRQLGSFVAGVSARCYLAEAQFLLGDWDDSLLHAELAASTAADADHHRHQALAHGVAALPCAARGDRAAAEHHVRAARAAADLVADATSTVWSGTAEAFLGAATRDPERVLSAAGRCLSHPGAAALQLQVTKPWRFLGAQAAAELGRLDEAACLLEGVHPERWPPSATAARTEHALTRALLAEAQGADDDAGSWYEVGRAEAERSSSPFGRARLLLAYGSFLRRDGRRRDARDLLEPAQRTFEQLGAAPWAERSARELEGLGLHPMRQAQAARTLTGQERAVAVLVGKGLRNKEVAAELFVSVKTVEYHLGNIYRKLGVSTRTQLAAVMHPGS